MKRKRKHATKKMEPNTPQELVITPEQKEIKSAKITDKDKIDKNSLLIIEILLLLMVGILAGLWYWKTSRATTSMRITDGGNSLLVNIPLTPTPIPLHPGSEIYSISLSEHAGPTIHSVTIDPLDVLRGQTMTIIADISDSSNISSVIGSLEMDSSKIDLNFMLDGGDSKKGSWKAEIVLTDSVFYTYTLTINASSPNGDTEIKVTPR